MKNIDPIDAKIAAQIMVSDPFQKHSHIMLEDVVAEIAIEELSFSPQLVTSRSNDLDLDRFQLVAGM